MFIPLSVRIDTSKLSIYDWKLKLLILHFLYIPLFKKKERKPTNLSKLFMYSRETLNRDIFNHGPVSLYTWHREIKLNKIAIVIISKQR